MIREVLTMDRLQAMDPAEAAALWTVRLAEGEHASERQLFEEWLRAAAVNRDAWEQAQRCWTLFDQAGEDEILEEMRRHARSAGPAARWNWKAFTAAAAALLVVVSTSILVERSDIFPGGGRSTAPTAPSEAAASLTYASGRELPRLINLPDGSRMTLDAQSKVTARFSGNQRTIELVAGRAFFDVRHDASRLFTVNAGNLRLVDIGTKFDVERVNLKVQVSLAEGRVSVSGPSLSSAILLSAGDRLTAEGDKKPEVQRIMGDALPSWQDGYASFDNMKLSDAAAILNRYPGPSLVVRDPRVADLRVSGMFRLGDAERFGRAIEQIYPVRVRQANGTVEIVPTG